MYFPYILYGCNLELNNEARLAAYLANRCLVCDEERPLANIHVTSSCDVLDYVLSEDEEGDPIVVAANYQYPAADAPWMDSSYPESARFMGFRVENISKPTHITRGVGQKISGSGGGILQTLRPGAQVYEIELLLFACDEQAMEFGFRYLVNGLAGDGCDEPCTLCDLEYRDSCHPIDGAPTVEEFNRGRWILKNVGMTSAPEWMDPPVRGLEYMVRRVRFSIASESPWKYTCPVLVTDSEVFVPEAEEVCGMSFEKFFCDKIAVSTALTEPSIVGETGFILELRAGSNPLSGVQIQIIPDEYGWVCDPAAVDRPAGYVDPDPCDIVYLEDLPPNHTLVYDSSTEKVSVITSTGAVFDGTPFISFDGTGKAPAYPVVRCGQFCLKVFVDECSISSGAQASVWTVHREY